MPMVAKEFPRKAWRPPAKPALNDVEDASRQKGQRQKQSLTAPEAFGKIERPGPIEIGRIAASRIVLAADTCRDAGVMHDLRLGNMQNLPTCIP